MKDSNQKVVIQSKPKNLILSEIGERFSFEVSRMLKEAHPNQVKRHILIKLIQQEVPHLFEDEIKAMINKYYGYAFERRTAGQFQRTFGIRPYAWLLSQFILDFRTAQISETKIASLATSMKFHFSNHFEAPKDVLSSDFIHMVIYQLINSASGQGQAHFDLTDFVAAWQKASHKKWGDRHDAFFVELLEHLATPVGSTDARLPISSGSLATEAGPELDITQTDLDWMKDVYLALIDGKLPPEYPLSRGPRAKIATQIQSLCRALSRPIPADLREKAHGAATALCRGCLSVYGQMPND